MTLDREDSRSDVYEKLKSRSLRISELLRSILWYRVTVIALIVVIVYLLIRLANPHYL